MFLVKKPAKEGQWGLFPVAQSENEFNKAPKDKVLDCTIKQSRNLSHHRLYWALVLIITEQTDYNKAWTHKAIKLGTGLYDVNTYRLDTGEMVRSPDERSISFAKMDQLEFDEWFQRVLDFVSQHIIPGLNSDELERQVRALVEV